MPDRALDSVCRQIADMAPDQFRQQLAVYRRFALSSPGGEGEGEGQIAPKAFADHEAAARQALAHLEALAKLTRWAAEATDGSITDRQGRPMNDMAAALEADLAALRRLADLPAPDNPGTDRSGTDRSSGEP